jgi:hypothetical protein
MGTVLRPTHLLLLHHSLGDQRINRRLRGNRKLALNIIRISRVHLWRGEKPQGSKILHGKEYLMKKLTFLATGLSLFTLASAGYAADHTLTAISAGGLTESSQPNLNGTNNPGRSAESVPGQGSPLSGEDHTTPATDTTNSGKVNTPPSVSAGKTAPSSHSAH